MIRWINQYIGTGPYLQVQTDAETEVVDVRDMVDKSGNAVACIKDKIERGVQLLKQGKKVIVCCDYGISRSNAIAAGIIAQFEAIPFDQAVRMVLLATGEKSIKVEVLNVIRKALTNGCEHSVKQTDGILLTGGTGFIGSRFKDQFAQQHNIVAPDSKTLNLLTDVVELDSIVKSHNINTIIHLANPRLCTLNNAIGSTLVMQKNILDVCRENAVRLIYSSCWEVYSGYAESCVLADETLAPYPRGASGEAKYFSEQLIELYVKIFGIEALILRFSPIYGPAGEKPRFIHNFIDKALRNKPIVTHRYSNGLPILDLIHIEDVNAALRKAVQSRLSGTINIGSGLGRSTYDIAHVIKKLTGSSSSIDTIEIDSPFSNIVMNTQKAKSVLSWKSSNEFEQWLQFHIEEIRKKGSS